VNRKIDVIFHRGADAEGKNDPNACLTGLKDDNVLVVERKERQKAKTIPQKTHSKRLKKRGRETSRRASRRISKGMQFPVLSRTRGTLLREKKGREIISHHSVTSGNQILKYSFSQKVGKRMWIQEKTGQKGSVPLVRTPISKVRKGETNPNTKHGQKKTTNGQRAKTEVARVLSFRNGQKGGGRRTIGVGFKTPGT